MLLRIPVVTAEQLIAAVASQQRGRAVFFRDLGAIIGRYRRRVAERLIVRGGDSWYCRDDVRGRHVILVMACAEMTGRDAGVLHLVVAMCLETDRIASRGLTGDLSQHAGN